MIALIQIYNFINFLKYLKLIIKSVLITLLVAGGGCPLSGDRPTPGRFPLELDAIFINP
jgi:hypothetical protein